MDVRLPDGTVIQNVPEGTTKADLVAKLKANGMDVPSEWLGQKTAEKPASPVDGMGTLETLRAGVGRGMAAVGRAVSGGVGQTIAGDVNRLVHRMLPVELPGRLPTSQESEAARVEAAQIDAPLLATKAGQVGNFVGQTAAVAPTMLIPGANTYTGAAMIGAGVGGLTTEGGADDRGRGAMFGALGGVAGKGLGDLLGVGSNKLAELLRNRQAARQTANAGRDAAAVAAKEAGYILPPTEVRPNALNSILEGLSGKIKTSQAASQQNKPVTNRLAKQAIGVADDAPLTSEALAAIRSEAGRSYDAVASAGVIQPGPKYAKALDDIVGDAKLAAKSFPNAKENPLINEIEALRSDSFDAGSAVAKIKELRARADTAYAQGDKQMGKALKKGAAALEDAIEEHLKVAGPEMLKQFRDARQLIAKTYTVESAMNKTTGDVSAAALAKQLAKGRPLSGELKTVAQVGSAFPKATQALPQNYNALSPLDYAVAAGTGNLAALAARPAARAVVLSRPYQALAVRPESYGSLSANALEQILGNYHMRRLLPAAVAAQSVPAR